MNGETNCLKQPVDWERIEELYRTGILSLREIARQCNITDTAIRKRAKRDAWVRDLSERVRAQVRTELVRGSVRSPGGGGHVRTDQEVVEAAAATVVEVVTGHRVSIESSRRIVSALTTHLRNAVEHRSGLEAAIVDRTATDRGIDRHARLVRAIALPGHIAAVKDLAMAQKVLIQLERQAFGLGELDVPTQADDPTSSAKRVTPSDEAMAKLTNLLASAASPA